MTNLEDEVSRKSQPVKKSIDRLRKELRRYTSFKAVFARGVLYGVATAIGATVVAALLLWILVTLFGPIIEELPFIEKTDLGESF